MSKKKGSFEIRKFAGMRIKYRQSLDQIIDMGFGPQEYIEHFPAFTGHLTLARIIALYEAYKMTLGVSGHIAEIGVYLGAGSLFFAKLMRIFEPSSTALVHGFEWFKGMKTTKEERHVEDGSCRTDYEKLMALIKVQGLDDIVRIHSLDASRDLPRFFDVNPHLQFKLILVDAGVYDVVKATLENFWPRLTSDGVIIFDHFNHEIAPGETRAIKEFMPDAKLKTFSFGWMPTAYVVKP